MDLTNPVRALGNPRFRSLLLAVAGVPVVAQSWYLSLQDTLSDTAGGGWRDFWVYLKAAAAIRGGGDPYALFLNSPDGDPTRAGRYIYPPLWAWVLQPLTQLPRVEAGLVLFIVSQLCFAGFVVIAARALRAGWQLAALVYILGAASYWFFDVLHEGQVEAVLLLLTAIWLLAWVEGDRLWGGLALGAATVIKLLQAPLLLLVVGRRGWRTAAGAGLAVMVAAAAAAPAFEPEFWLRVLPSLSGGTAYVENQSPAGALYRLFGTGAAAHVGAALIAALLAAVTLWALGYRPRADRHGRALEAAAVAALVPLLTPVTWGHHLFAEMLPIFVVLQTAIGRRAWPGVAAVLLGWALANPVHLESMVIQRSSLAGTGAAAVLAESALAGSIVVWGSAVWLLRPSLLGSRTLRAWARRRTSSSVPAA